MGNSSSNMTRQTQKPETVALFAQSEALPQSVQAVVIDKLVPGNLPQLSLTDRAFYALSQQCRSQQRALRIRQHLPGPNAQIALLKEIIELGS